MSKALFRFTALLLLISLSGCSGRLFTVHKIDVQQGNAVDPEKVEQLQVGMNKEQVRFLMGSPLIHDAFHPDRWDYVYHLIPDYGDTERRHVAVFFEGDKVMNIEKSDMPPEEQPEVEAEEET
ncbi:MAG: outer membrane protein assembly factor BamE [Gammaproteobacteria bacterium]